MTGAESYLRPIVVGTNHRSSSLGLRDALFIEESEQEAALGALKKSGVDQAALISTCDRVEMVAFHADPEAADRAVRALLGAKAGIAPEKLAGSLYRLADQDAVRHLFGVASSLDSLIVGEPQVLGQVKASYRMAKDAGTSGAELDDLMAAAFGAAKRVRTETSVAERPVSIASAAGELAHDIHGGIEACNGLLLGAGDMGTLIAESLMESGLRRMVAAAPRPSQAEQVAAALNCHLGEMGNMANLLAEADIVITALNGRRAAIEAEQIHQALRKRKKKPVFLIDAGIPGDVDPAVDRLDGAFLYDLSDLERVAMEGRASRQAAAREGWAIVDAEVQRYYKERTARQAVPAIVALRGRFETMRDEVLAEAGQDAEKATRLLVSRLLHDPSLAMKDMAGEPATGKWSEAERLLKKLFRLGD